MYYVLLIGLLTVTAAAFWLSRYELLSPMTLMPLGFVMAAVLALIGTSSWNHIALRRNALAIIVIGCAAFVAGCYCVDWFAKRRESNQPQQSKTSELVMKSGSAETYVKYAILIAVILAAIALRIYETYRLGNQLELKYHGFNDLSMQVRRRTATIFTTQNIRLGIGFSVVERQMEKIGSLSGYISVFLLISNLMNRTAGKKRFVDAGCAVLSLLLSCIFVLLCGSRTQIMYYCMAALLIWFVLALREKKHTSMQLSVRLLLVLVPLFFIAVASFYVGGKLIGRTPTSGPVSYISFYLGAGIPSLQWLLDHIGSITTVPGGFTFYGVYSLLYKVGLIDSLHIYSIQWVKLEGYNSNIFTMFARYYLDFRWLGVVVFSAFAGAVYTLLYRWAKRTSWPMVFVVFAWTGAYLFDTAREEFLFSRFLSSSNLVILILLVLGTWIMTTSFTDMIKNLKAKKTGKAVQTSKEQVE